jgi:ABC-type uncharacterized transport system YnjBCD permease subunit
VLLLFHCVCCLLFLLLGYLFSKGKCVWLIAGYNTSSSDKKKQIDEKALCGFTGRLMFALADCWCLIVISDLVESRPLLWLGLILFFLAAIGGAVYANTGKRFEKREENHGPMDL